MTRALLYVRQSDSDGQGERSLSLDSQATVLREDAARFGWHIVDEIRDADLKGYDEQRPGLLALYQRVRAGDVDIVAFWKLDRLARLLRLQENVLHELGQLGVDVYSNQDPHIGTPLFRQVSGAFNEELTRIISANVRRALRERARRGLSHGPPPFGYCRPKKDGPLAYGEDAETVGRIFQWRDDGVPIRDIVRRLHGANVRTPRGGLTWSPAAVRFILANPVYRGALVLHGETKEGTHEAIVDVEQWQRVQERREIHALRVKPEASWLEGLIVHACGAPMYLTARSDLRSTSFRCRSTAGGELSLPPCAVQPRQIVVAHAEALAWERLSDDLAALEPWRNVFRRAKAEHRAANPSTEDRRRAASDHLARVETARERWLEMYASGDIDRPKLDRELAKVNGQRAELQAELAAMPSLPDGALIEEAWTTLHTLRKGMVFMEPSDRALVLRQLGAAVVSPAGHKIRGGRSARGQGIDAGQVTIRYRPEFAPFFRDGNA